MEESRKSGVFVANGRKYFSPQGTVISLVSWQTLDVEFMPKRKQKNVSTFNLVCTTQILMTKTFITTTVCGKINR